MSPFFCPFSILALRLDRIEELLLHHFSVFHFIDTDLFHLLAAHTFKSSITLHADRKMIASHNWIRDFIGVHFLHHGDILFCFGVDSLDPFHAGWSLGPIGLNADDMVGVQFLMCGVILSFTAEFYQSVGDFLCGHFWMIKYENRYKSSSRERAERLSSGNRFLIEKGEMQIIRRGSGRHLNI